MKSKLNIDPSVLAHLGQMVLRAFRRLFTESRQRRDLPDLPTFDGGGSRVDIADRDALYRILDGF